MKIVSSDPARLVAVDKAYGNLVVGLIMAIVSIFLFVVGFRQTGALLGGAVFLGVAVLLMLTRKVRTLTADKAQSQAVFSAKSLLGSHDYPYAFSDIVKVQLVSAIETQVVNTVPQRSGVTFGQTGNTETDQVTQLSLVLKNGTMVNLANGRRQMFVTSLFSSVPDQGVGKQIADFIGVPFELAGPGTVGQTMTPTVNNAAPSVVPADPAPTSDTIPAPTIIPPAAPPENQTKDAVEPNKA